MVGLTLDSRDIEAKKAFFMESLSSQGDNFAIVNQHVLHGSCFAIGETAHYELKQEIALNFSLEVNQDIFIVGSAKMGFSVAPHKRYRDFGDRSDIDVAIVSHDLYQKVWHEVHAYSESGADWPRKSEFESYAAWGWIRPDKLPGGNVFKFANEWWDFFRSLQQSRRFGPYKIAAGIYHDMYFLKSYQTRAIAACRLAK